MKESFKKLIVEWWERKLPELIEREASPKITEDVLAIIGPRRVGKTYLMYQLIKQLLKTVPKEEILYIDFEDNRLVGLKAEEADEMFVAYKELTAQGLKYLFFDEVQAFPYWSNFVRKLHNLKKYKIIVSGSSAKLLSKEIATELRGRYKSIFLSLFSFKEFLGLNQFVYSPQIEYSERKGELLRFFNTYLEQGGYPEIITEKDLSEKRIKLRSYFETIFYKDIIERHKVTNHVVLEQMMVYLLNNPAKTFSITGFEKILRKKEIYVSKNTISLYLKYLEEAFFVNLVEEFSYSPKKRLMRPKKVYLVDNGLIRFLSSQFSPESGRLLENCVALELKRKEREVFFFQEKYECDFVVKEGIKINQTIQVCWEINEENEKREIKGLVEAMDFFKINDGLLLTYDQEKDLKIDSKKIKFLPVWKWLLKSD